MPEVLSVCSVQYKCITDAQRRKAALPGRGLEYVDGQGARHEPVPFTFMAADGVEMPLEVMSEQLPILKARWIATGDTQALLASLEVLVSRAWRITIARYEPLSFIAWP